MADVWVELMVAMKVERMVAGSVEWWAVPLAVTLVEQMADG